MKDRQQLILDRLDGQGACSYRELTQWLGVSAMTVRRDVDELARRGAAIKTLGGVQKANAPSYLYETTLLSRLSAQRQEKRAIAEQAIELISPPQTIFLDGSTTCLELAKLVGRQLKGLTIVTNSALACLELGQGSENTVLGIGGQYDPACLSFAGPTSEDAAREFFVDIAFVSTKGFLPNEGTFESSVATFRIKQIIAEQCGKLVLLVDHSKFGRRALCKVLDVSQIHVVVTDSHTSEADRAQIESKGCKVVIGPLLQEMAQAAEAHGNRAHVTIHRPKSKSIHY